ncbi:MAG: transcription antitermination factor NusB [Xanthomonadales bacterium]|nr:transcription antitermination factor NusB [Xanthomonadales bacterium]
MRRGDVDPARRTRARRRALQALYALELSGNPVGQVLAEFAEERDPEKADVAYFEELVRGVCRERERIDAALAPVLDRPIARVDPVERCALRIGVYELLFRAELPFKVVIDEAVQAARQFGADYGYAYVNGVLDRLARELRPQETRSVPARED